MVATTWWVEIEALLILDRVPVPKEITATRVSGIPVAYSLLTDDGRAFAMYASQHLDLFRPEVRAWKV